LPNLEKTKGGDRVNGLLIHSRPRKSQRAARPYPRRREEGEEIVILRPSEERLPRSRGRNSTAWSPYRWKGALRKVARAFLERGRGGGKIKRPWGGEDKRVLLSSSGGVPSSPEKGRLLLEERGKRLSH